VNPRALLIALLLGSCSAPPPPPPLDPSLREKVDTGARELVAHPKSAGLAIGLLRDGVPHVLGYGRISDTDPAAPGGDTVFEIGSLTKTFTGILLDQAVRDGVVALEDPLAKHLPKDVRVPSRNGKDITLLHLATHRSGLPPLPSNFAPKDATNPYADFTVEDLYDCLDTLELARDPGAKYDYSNLGMGLLGHILALKAGRPYESLVVERICAPLGMTDTRVALDAGQKRRLAPGHDSAGNAAPNWDLPTLAGAGALRSTANDLLRYLAANLGDAYAATHVERARIGKGQGIGLAWHRMKLADTGPVIVWHNGRTGGYRSWAGFVAETKTAVVVLSNCTVDVDLLGVALLNALQDVK
jgi:CubicO group peptidase (beta-lactamase class C family)